MNSRVKKIILVLLAAACLFGSGRLQQSMNADRDSLGLTRTAVLENAPPALAFTTVALGGFRGLISNLLWIRANDLQQDDKYFEAAQLADWITKLEPTYAQVWVFQAWNMAYNISVKFKENAPGIYADRWHWVERGIQLLRDDGLRYNPNSMLIYRELGWFFQHKMGQNLDDGNRYYKLQWADEMKPFFGPNGTNFDRLLQPQTKEDYQTLEVLTNRYKIDPAFAKSLDQKYGPFDWRLPEAHAIYWGAMALEEATAHPDRVTTSDVITVRRIIYQSMLQAFHHGRLLADPFNRPYLGPDLELIPQVNQAYLDSFAEEPDPNMKVGILRAHRNFLRDAVYFLYEANRTKDAQKWFTYLGDRYPDLPVVENDPNSKPKNLTLDEYAYDVINIDIRESSEDRVTAAIEGYITRSYEELATGDEDRFEGFQNLARMVYKHYTASIVGHGSTTDANLNRIPLPPWDDLNRQIVRQLLDPQQGMPYAARAVLRTQLRMPAESAAPPATTPPTLLMNSTNALDGNVAAPVVQ